VIRTRQTSIQLLTELLLAQSILGLHIVSLQLVVPCLQLGHTGGGAALGQLLGGLL